MRGPSSITLPGRILAPQVQRGAAQQRMRSGAVAPGFRDVRTEGGIDEVTGQITLL
jgi:hypothetical protein